MSKKFDLALIGLGVGANYGSVLTYYGLYKTLERFGKTVVLVPKIGASLDDPELSDTHAMRFAKEHYELSKVYNKGTVGDINKIASGFIIGSDQVFNYGISRNFGKAFYFDFVEDSKLKLAYASSFGHAVDFAPEEEVPQISKLMKRFNAISVREDSGVDLARDVYNVPATQVAEPIFLLDRKEYDALSERSTRDVSEPYLLAYILDPTPEKKAAIEHVAKELGLKPRIMLDAWEHLFAENSQKMDMPGAIEENIDTYDFLKLYSNASYVITDSFHGTAFALKFEKPFASIANKRRGIARFNSIFKLIGTRKPFTHDATTILKEPRFLEPLNYTEISAKIDNHVRDSKKWLENALKIKPSDTIGKVPLEDDMLNIRKLKRATNTISSTVQTMLRILSQSKIDLRAPKFEASSDAWNISTEGNVTKIKVASPEDVVRGNLVWTNLDGKLREDDAYELEIEWAVRTLTSYINIHLRDAASARFKVVGTIAVGGDLDKWRVDKISFKVPAGEYSQLMFGAVHFSGPNGGADIKSIRLKPIKPQDVVPNSAAVAEKASRDPAKVVRAFADVDTERFLRHYAKHRVSKNTRNARSLLMFYAHGFEKGLSRQKNFRPGFGEASMIKISEEMDKWIKNGHDPKDSFFQIAASVLKFYFNRHRSLDFDVSHFWRMFSPAVQREIENAEEFKGQPISAALEREALVEEASSRTFVDVAFSRRSIREFTPEPVDMKLVNDAVRIAMQAPSVCNRQSVRIHLFEDQQLMRSALALQGGFGGYKMPPKLALITSDLSAFVGPVERNQAFIDGGLFMMGFLLGLEEKGLGGCSLNTALGKEKEATIRRLLGIPDSEVFIAFVALGHYEKDVWVPKSTRLPIDEVLIPHKK